MKKPTTKIIFLFGLYIALHFLAACYKCNCGNVEFPFFDYQALTVTANDPATASVLWLDITPAETSLLADISRCQTQGFNFITTALGCDCIGNGDDGPKFTIASFKVFADRAFDDLIPVDSSLTAMFTYSLYSPSINREVALSFPEIYDIHRSLRLTTPRQPKDPELPIRFTIQIIKSNSDTVSIQTDTIRFQ